MLSNQFPSTSGGDIHEAPSAGDAHEEDRLDGVVKGERFLCQKWER